MLTLSQQQRKKYYQKSEKFFRYKNRLKFVEVSFSDRWWKVLWKQRWQILPHFIGDFISGLFLASFPFLISLVFSSKDWRLLLIIGAFWLFLNFLSNFYIRAYLKVAAQTIQSVYISASRFFLTVDPLSHSTRSTGQVFAKVIRGSESYENVTDIVVYDFLTLFSGVVAAHIILAIESPAVAMLSLTSFIFMAAFSVVIWRLAAQVTIDEMINADDQRKEVATEALMQVQYIRSSFATNNMFSKIIKTAKKMMITSGTEWSTHVLIESIVRSFYALTVIGVALYLLYLVNTGQLNVEPAIGIALTYFAGTADVLTFGRNFLSVTQAIEEINDLYSFIRNFGKQTYPVLEEKIDTK